MTRDRLLSIAVVVLVLLNVATLSIHLLHRVPHGGRPPREGPKRIIIERLNFDADQVSVYEELIRDHRYRIDSLDERMKELRGSLYSSHDGIASDSLIQLIGGTQSAIERVHAAHFNDISMLCRPDQLPLYEELSKDLVRYFHPGTPPPKERR